MDDAFEVEFGCTNCEKEWSETYPERTIVGKPHRSDRVRVNDKDCEKFGPDCDTCGPIRCPNCDLLDYVEVRDRDPLDDEVNGGNEDGGEAAA